MSCRYFLGRLFWMFTNRIWGLRGYISFVFIFFIDLGMFLF